MADRILIEIVTAANMAGVEEANAGMLKMNAATAGLAIGLGALVFVGKAAIDNAEAQEKAHKALGQAMEVNQNYLYGLQGQFDDWSEANKRYVSNQYLAEESLASFVRTGVTGNTAMRELNAALDLSVLKNEDMATATESVIKALAGNSRGLKDLGITTEEYNAIWKNKGLSQAQKQAELLALIESKTKDGRKAQTDLAQSSNELNKDWQDITSSVGPPLLGLLSGLAGGADAVVSALKRLGADRGWNDFLSSALGHVQDLVLAIAGDVLSLLHNFQEIGQFFGAPSSTTYAPGAIGNTRGRRQHGGPVSAGGAYLVGESGPETLVMGSQGGYVSPSGAGGGGSQPIVIHNYLQLDGHTLDLFTNTVIRRGRMAPGT